MFFSRFFTKNSSQLRTKADRLFADDHFAEARLLYLEAAEKSASVDNHSADHLYLQAQISRTGNKLAELNIAEAEAAMRSGNLRKGSEHLHLALELADDVSLREKAETLFGTSELSNENTIMPVKPHKSHGCASCSSPATTDTELHDPTAEHLTAAEQFQLLVNTLPGDLPLRYSQLGEKFASAYLLAHTEKAQDALVLLNELLSTGENDVYLYEAALLYFRGGEPLTCERLLQRALQVNSANPLCHLSLAQLYTDSERYDEAIAVLGIMLDGQILTDQAVVMLGDVRMLQGNYDQAIEIFKALLDSPALKKTAAERLVRILTSQGRESEAAYLIKTYLKGCC